MPVVAFLIAAASPEDQQAGDLLRQKAEKIMQDGNFKEAFDLFQKLATDPIDNPDKVGSDLLNGITCLNRLNRMAEDDAFRESVIAVHSNNWQLLRSAAQSYYNEQHYGTIVAGAFQRGPHRGGDGKWVNTFDRDRVRALQLMIQGMEKGEALVKADKDKSNATVPFSLADLYIEFARMVMGYSGYGEAWRLQYRSDFTQLPDYNEGYRYYYGGDSGRGAPVDERGNPVFHQLPKGWQESTSDGERWRWLLNRAMELNPKITQSTLLELANFFN